MPVISRITPQTLTAYQVSMANAATIVELLAELGTEGVSSTIALIPAPGGGLPDYQITVRQANYIDQIANIEDWIVTGSEYVLVFPNLTFLATFTCDTPLVWGSTTVAPTVTANSGLTASIVVPQPSSPNGPWTYSVSQTDTTANTTEAVSATESLINGNMTLTVSGLTEGDDYTFIVTVATTQYQDVTAVSSLSSQPITATT